MVKYCMHHALKEAKLLARSTLYSILLSAYVVRHLSTKAKIHNIEQIRNSVVWFIGDEKRTCQLCVEVEKLLQIWILEDRTITV